MNNGLQYSIKYFVQIELLLHLLVRLLVLLGLPFLMNLSFFFIHFTLTSSTVLTASDPQVKLAMDDNSTSELM